MSCCVEKISRWIRHGHIQGALNLGQEVKEKGKNPWRGNLGLNPYLISGPLIDMALPSPALDPNYTTASSSQPYHLYNAKNRLGRQSSFSDYPRCISQKRNKPKGNIPLWEIFRWFYKWYHFQKPQRGWGSRTRVSVPDLRWKSWRFITDIHP